MFKNTLAVLSSLLVLSGCVLPPTSRPLEEQRSYIDKTVSVPTTLFTETPESKSVILGSSTLAQASGCHLMQRYKVRTASNFSDSLNLMKHRAALMGAKRLTIVRHEEVDASKGRIVLQDDDTLYIQAGTSLQGALFHTTIIADLYDCGR